MEEQQGSMRGNKIGEADRQISDQGGLECCAKDLPLSASGDLGRVPFHGIFLLPREVE